MDYKRRQRMNCIILFYSGSNSYGPNPFNVKVLWLYIFNPFTRWESKQKKVILQLA